jgi:hypothetical protein
MPKTTNDQRLKRLKDLDALRDARAGSYAWHLVEAADSKTKREYAKELHSAVCTLALVTGYEDLRLKLIDLAGQALERSGT